MHAASRTRLRRTRTAWSNYKGRSRTTRICDRTFYPGHSSSPRHESSSIFFLSSATAAHGLVSPSRCPTAAAAAPAPRRPLPRPVAGPGLSRLGSGHIVHHCADSGNLELVYHRPGLGGGDGRDSGEAEVAVTPPERAA
jgi:hypothetical protein